jgi:hypothetical protein
MRLAGLGTQRHEVAAGGCVSRLGAGDELRVLSRNRRDAEDVLIGAELLDHLDAS